MARAPNYRFERQERDKAKAAKKEAKAEAKAAKQVEEGEPEEDSGASPAEHGQAKESA